MFVQVNRIISVGWTTVGFRKSINDFSSVELLTTRAVNGSLLALISSFTNACINQLHIICYTELILLPTVFTSVYKAKAALFLDTLVIFKPPLSFL